MNIKDRLLIERVLQGDKNAIVQLWNIWTGKIMTFLINGGVTNLEDGEDLIQNIMLKVYSSLEKYNPFYSPSTWIYTICRNQLADYWKKRKTYNIENTDSIPGHLSPEDNLENIETINQIQDYIIRQNPSDRQIIFLHFYESLSIRATAKILEKPYETIRYRVKLIKKKLKEILS